MCAALRGAGIGVQGASCGRQWWAEVRDRVTSTPSAEHAPAAEALGDHYETVVLNLLRGRVTPVLGAGASLYGRAGLAAPEEQPTWQGGGHADLRRATSSHWYGAPSAAELAEYLAREFKVGEPSRDLLHIAQWVYALRGGSGGLYDALHDIFAREFPATALHDFLAAV